MKKYFLIFILLLSNVAMANKYAAIMHLAPDFVVSKKSVHEVVTILDNLQHCFATTVDDFRNSLIYYCREDNNLALLVKLTAVYPKRETIISLVLIDNDAMVVTKDYPELMKRKLLSFSL